MGTAIKIIELVCGLLIILPGVILMGLLLFAFLVSAFIKRVKDNVII